jgi:hypothetical protein
MGACENYIEIVVNYHYIDCYLCIFGQHVCALSHLLPNIVKMQEVPRQAPHLPEMLLNIEDYHTVAKTKLTKPAYDYYESGSDDQV